MITTVQNGEPFEVPVDASFIVEFQTAFSVGEMGAASATVPYYVNKIDQGVWPATIDGTSVLLAITPGMLQAGNEYELSPVVRVGSDFHRPVRAVAMKALAAYVPNRPASSCYQIA